MKHYDRSNLRCATIKSSSFPNQTIPCLFGEVKGSRLVVQAESAVESSTVVTVEYQDELFLGEVITRKQDGEAFTLEIKLEQVLSGLQSLMALRSRLLCDSPLHTPSVLPLSNALVSR